MHRSDITVYVVCEGIEQTARIAVFANEEQAHRCVAEWNQRADGSRLGIYPRTLGESDEWYADLGEIQAFYGVDMNDFKLGGRVWRAVEDPRDGLRSCLGFIEVTAEQSGIFPIRSVAFVKREKVTTEVSRDRMPKLLKHLGAYDFEGYLLRDIADGHIWLAVGTANAGDYYPFFVFHYTPRKAQ